MDDLKAELAFLLEERTDVETTPERIEEIDARVEEIREERSAGTVTVIAPAAVRVPQLRDELAAALKIPAPYVELVDDGLDVIGMVNESMRAKIEAAVAAHSPNADYGKSPEDRELAALRMKAQAVFDGSESFTPAQVQKILAAGVLRATR